MNGFFHTLAYGLAALCIVLLVAGVTTLQTLRAQGQLNVAALRPLVLTEEEQAWLKKKQQQALEPPPAPVPTPTTEQELLSHIADLAGASHVNQLMSRLRRQQEALDERQQHLDQQWSEIQLAKAGLERVQRQLTEQERQLGVQTQKQADEHARWAAAQADEAKRILVMDEIEKNRYREQAKLFEQMKDNAWQSLRRFSAREIARYLALMEPKKSARLLVLAQQDQENPTLATAIHQEMLRQDLSGASGNQVQRLATLYSFMPTEQIVRYLTSSSPQEVADIIQTMEATTPVKKRAELLEALRKQDSQRELEIRQRLDDNKQKTPPASG